jgi:hypothetical protein
LIQERHDSIQRGPGGVPRLVDEIDRQHRMRLRGDPVGIAWRGVDFDALEGLAERLAQRLESLRRTGLVARETQPEDAQPLMGGLLR